MSKNKMNSQDLGEKIVKELKSIFDPEIPVDIYELCLLYTSPSPRDRQKSRMPSSA